MSEFEDYQAAEQKLRDAGLDPAKFLAPYDGPTPQEAAGAAASRSLRSGGVPPGKEPSEDPTSLRPYLADKAAGVPTGEAQRRQIQRIINAGVAGDERVLYDSDRWRMEHGGYRDRGGAARTY